MSLLLSVPQFQEARARARQGEITPEMLDFLHRLVAVARATRSLAPAAVVGGRWDDPDAVQETVQAWLAESLLDGGLLQAFDSCLSPAALSRYLERALRNWLISRSRARSGPRLLQRAAALLDDDPDFVQLVDASSVADRWWALSAWDDPEPFTGTDEEVIAACWALGDLPVLRFSSSERSDPVLSSPDLRKLLLDLLARVGAALSGAQLDRVFRERFAYAYQAQDVDLDDVPELQDESTVEEQVLVHDGARVALGDLTERQLQILLRRPPATLEQLAEELQISRGTVDNEQRRALMKVAQAAPSRATLQPVLETLRLMASGISE